MVTENRIPVVTHEVGMHFSVLFNKLVKFRLEKKKSFNSRYK